MLLLWHCGRYLVLADYDPLSERELGLRQMDQVRINGQ